jgi:hypothetical protein
MSFYLAHKEQRKVFWHYHLLRDVFGNYSKDYLLKY